MDEKLKSGHLYISTVNGNVKKCNKSLVVMVAKLMFLHVNWGVRWWLETALVFCTAPTGSKECNEFYQLTRLTEGHNRGTLCRGYQWKAALLED